MVHRVCVVYNSLNPRGGAEVLTVKLVSVLTGRLGCEVTLNLAEKPTNESISQYLPCLKHVKIRWLPFGSFFGSLRYGGTLLSMCNEVFTRLNKCYDVIVNTAGVYSPLSLYGDLIYVHSDQFDLNFLNSQKALRRAYGLALKMLSLPFGSNLAKKANQPQMVLANSHFTLSLTKQLHRLQHTDSYVLYPPVDVRSISSKGVSDIRERNLVITISRFSREKNLIVIPRIAKELPNAKFVIVGSIRDRGYFASIVRETKKHNLSNLKILLDVDRNTIMNLLRKSTVYLNPMRFEPFGISVVEGMAAGLVPVVSNSGGAQEFVPLEWRYDATEEIREKIEGAISASNQDLAEDMVRRALKFDTEEFEKNAERLLRLLI